MKENLGISSPFDYRLIKSMVVKDFSYEGEKLIKLEDEKDDNVEKSRDKQRLEHIQSIITIKDDDQHIVYCPRCHIDKETKIPVEYPWNHSVSFEYCEEHHDDQYENFVHQKPIYEILSLIIPHYYTNTKLDEQIKEIYDKDLSSMANTHKPFIPKKTSSKLIVGNVGAGKSTFSNKLSTQSEKHVVVEDVLKWNSSLVDNLLSKSSTSKEADINFQWFLIGDTLSKMDFPIQESGIVGVLIHIVAKTLRGRFTYQDFLNFAISLTSVDWSRFEIIWINTSPSECLERIRARGKTYDQHFNILTLKSLQLAMELVIPFFKYTIVKGDEPFVIIST